MTQETQWLDYSKPPPGHEIVIGPKAIPVLWAHYKREYDPPGLSIPPWLAAAACTEARAASWAWHDRRRAIAYDIYSQTCGGKALAVLMAAAIRWTDAECAEVEAYAALAFPRSVDMPAPLQRVLLPQGAT